MIALFCSCLHGLSLWNILIASSPSQPKRLLCIVFARLMCRKVTQGDTTSNLASTYHVWEIVICKYMRVVSKFFHLEKRHLRQKKKLLSPNFRELHVFLSRYMLAKIFKKNVDVWYPQIAPGVVMLVLASRCWSLLTFIGQFWHNKSTVLGHLAFKWRSSFAKALAKLSPNFREKIPQ